MSLNTFFSHYDLNFGIPFEINSYGIVATMWAKSPYTIKTISHFFICYFLHRVVSEDSNMEENTSADRWKSGQ